MADLHDLPRQPDGVPWPTGAWERADPPPEAAGGLPAALDALLGPDADPDVGHTNAVAIVHRGRLVAERYGERQVNPLAELAGVEPGPITPDEPLGSWSMAKSVLHLAVGVAQAQGHLAADDPVPEPRWQGPGDPRAEITWDDLLTMRAGLEWTEVYEGFSDSALPDVVEMLFGGGAEDMEGYAADKALAHRPGSPEAYCYSSGTSNIVAGCLRRALGLEGTDLDDWIRRELLAPVGIERATMGHDGTGLWVGSSYLHLVVRDWLRLGLLVLRGGTWDGREVVPPDWIDHGRFPRSLDEGKAHGAHWWSWPDRTDGTFMAHGFEGQRLLLVPDRDLVVFRQGMTTSAGTDALNRRVLALVDLFPVAPGP